MASGFAGAGYIDPVTGEWVPGTTLNTPPPDIPFATPQGGAVATRPITTPNSSSGQPAVQDPSATGWDLHYNRPNNPLATTPNSRTGAPAPGVRTMPNPATMPTPGAFPMGGPLATGAALVANAPSTPEEIAAQANKVNSWVDNSALGKWLIKMGITQPYQGMTATQPAGSPSAPAATPVATADGTPPPGGTPPLPPVPPGGLRPPLAPPISPNLVLPPSTAKGKGKKGQTSSAPLAPPAPADVNLGHYRATVGNARGSTWVPGGMDDPAPQIYRGPQTVAARGGTQNYYIPGSAPMGPGDWTGMPAAAPPGAAGGARAPMPVHPAVLAAQVANHPAARAPVIQSKRGVANYAPPFGYGP